MFRIANKENIRFGRWLNSRGVILHHKKQAEQKMNSKVEEQKKKKITTHTYTQSY